MWKYVIFNDITSMFLLLASLIKYVQQSGGYYNSIFYTEGVCGMRSMTLSKEKRN